MSLFASAINMALPTIKSVTDCATYSKAFEPFLPQLYNLHNQVYASVANVESLKQLYITTNPAISGLGFAIASFPIFLIISEINRNYSQVDRVWSILPTVFNFHYALWARMNGLPTQRLDNVLAFSVLWSCRLTFNYWRRGGYQIGSEDYRWELIKKRIGSVGFFLLNVFFIASIQPVSRQEDTLLSLHILIWLDTSMGRDSPDLHDAVVLPHISRAGHIRLGHRTSAHGTGGL